MNTYSPTQINNNDHSNTRRAITIVALLLITAVVTWIAISPHTIAKLINMPTPLSNAINLWETQELDSYSYDLQISCFCLPEVTRPVSIIVSNGIVQSVTYVDDGTMADPDLFASYSTVDKLFERLEIAQSQNPATFNVTFDEQYGVPQSVSIDLDEMMADEEIYFTVSNFAASP